MVLPEEAETGPAQVPAVTDIRQDVADFDSRFGLPPARIQVIRTTLAGSSASPWLASVEEVEDTELVHAVAPDATIRELLVDPADVSTPAKLAATWATAVRIAARNGEVISQSGIGQDFSLGEDSWTSAEVATMNSALQYAAARQVTVVVASGDEGVIGNGSAARGAHRRPVPRGAAGRQGPLNQRRRVRIACTRGYRHRSRTATPKKRHSVTGRKPDPG